MNLSDLPLSSLPVLNFRPLPLDGESWPGYLTRLADANGLQGLTGLAKTLGLTPIYLMAQNPHDIALLLSIPWTPPEADSDLPLDRPLSQPPLRPNLARAGRTLHARVCPTCLRTDKVMHARAAWDHPLALTCREHDTLLLDTCPACGLAIHHARPHLGQCTCGYSFVEHKPEFSPGWVKQLEQVFSEAFSPRDSRTFAHASDAAQSAVLVINWLLLPAIETTGRRPSRNGVKIYFVSLQRAREFANILKHWPDELAAQLAPEARPLSERNMERLSNRLNAGTFASMRLLYEQIRQLATKNRPSSRRVVSLSEKIASRDFFGIKDLMAATGHSYQGLKDAIDVYLIPGATYERDPFNGTLRFFIPRDSFLSIVQRFERTVDLEQGAHLVGCSTAALRGIAGTGLVRTDTLLRGGYTCRIDKESLHELAGRLYATARKGVSIPALERVYFSGWFVPPYRADQVASWKRHLAAILDGVLPVYSATATPTALNDLFLRKGDLTRFRNSRPRKK